MRKIPLMIFLSIIIIINLKENGYEKNNLVDVINKDSYKNELPDLWTPKDLSEIFNDLEKTSFIVLDLLNDVTNLTDKYVSYLENIYLKGHKIYLFEVDKIKNEESLESFMDEYYTNLTIPKDYDESTSFFILYAKSLNKVSVKTEKNLYFHLNGLEELLKNKGIIISDEELQKADDKIKFLIQTYLNQELDNVEDENIISILMDSLIDIIKEESTLTPKDLADSAKKEYNPEKHYLLHDFYSLFELKDYFEGTYLPNRFSSKNVYVLMFLIKDMSSSFTNQTKFLNLTVSYMNLTKIDVQKQTEIYILHIINSKSIAMIVNGKLFNKFPENTITEMTQKALSKINDTHYEYGYYSLFNDIQDIVDKKEKGKALSKTWIIIICVDVGLILMFIFIFLMCFYMRRKAHLIDNVRMLADFESPQSNYEPSYQPNKDKKKEEKKKPITVNIKKEEKKKPMKYNASYDY